MAIHKYHDKRGGALPPGGRRRRRLGRRVLAAVKRLSRYG